MKDYYVTASAGLYVAGQRHEGVGTKITLSDEAAYYDVSAGHLSLEKPSQQKEATKSSSQKGKK